MKAIFIFLIISAFSLTACGQKKFDIINYTAPKNWTEKTGAENVTFSTDDKDGNFCIISVYKSVAAGNDSKQNFDMSWQTLIQNTIYVSDAAMQPVVNDDGWETQTGSSQFNNEGISGTVILLASTKAETLVNIVILLNGDKYILEMETFLESLSMNIPKKSITETKEIKTNKITTPKHEVWMSYKYNMMKKRFESAFVLKYETGDCLDYVPEEGIIGFSKKTDNKKDRHWGTAVTKGKEIHITYPGYVRKLGKVSATKMSYPPDSKITFYHKCASVDGLKLNGVWSADEPEWYKKQNTNAKTIRFYADGRFENNKGFVCMKETSEGFKHRDSGSGTYYIKDFTLVLTYNDGEIWTSALTGLKDINPAKDNSMLLFRQVVFYKKLN